MIAFDELLACLTDVRAVGDGSDPSAWSAGTLGLEGGQVFGGQMIGQAITIAARTLPDMAVKSVDVVFPRSTRDSTALGFHVTRLHAGNAYATLRIESAQPDREGSPAVGFSATVMCHRPATGIEHQTPAPTTAGRPDAARLVDLGLVPWETRLVGEVDLDSREAQPNELMLWSRVDRHLGDDPAVHQSLLAFMSELTLIGTALLPHAGLSQLDAHAALRTSVIGHHILFHRPCRVDEWLLIAQSSPVASNGSAYSAGHVYTEDGTLVASFSQQSMIRVETGS